MSSLDTYFQKDTASGSRFTLFIHPGFESHGILLKEAFPAMESQQVDLDAQQKLINDIKDQLNNDASEEERNAQIKAYLLGSDYVPGNEEDEATVQALVNSALNDPDHTVAALLPMEGAHAKPGLDGELEPSIPLSKVREFLETNGVKVVDSVEALRDCLMQYM